MQFPGMNRFTNDGVLSITVFSKKAPWYESKPKPGGVGELGVEASFLFFLHKLQQEPAEQRHCNVMSCGWS